MILFKIIFKIIILGGESSFGVTVLHIFSVSHKEDPSTETSSSKQISEGKNIYKIVISTTK